MSLKDKRMTLQQLLSELGTAAVAFSGGVDSTFLLKTACDTLGPENVLALTAVAPVFPAYEIEQCSLLAQTFNVSMEQVSIDLLSIPDVRANGPLRCYHCKQEIFSRLKVVAKEHGIETLIEGSNRDDLDDYRPGRKAVEELGIRSPLLEADLTKQEIRTLSETMNLPTWNKQAFACLATRIPYGEEIKAEQLQKIATCEEFLRREGFLLYRVRVNENAARIEISPHEMIKIVENDLRVKIIQIFQKNGFDSITLDLQGYRSGSMNDALLKSDSDRH